MASSILSIDAGTSGIRTVLYNHKSEPLGYSYETISQTTPASGLLEQDPLEILNTIQRLIKETIQKAGVAPSDIAALGVATQRASVVAWDAFIGKPEHPALIWQDLRTIDRCKELSEATGMNVSPIWSLTKVEWLLTHIEDGYERFRRQELLVGTLDSWIIWNVTKERAFVTDPSNACSTGLYDVHKGAWSQKAADLIGISTSWLADVKPSSHLFGHTTKEWIGAEIPVAAVAGDQQSALIGHLCLDKGAMKATYGTSVMVNVNTGTEKIKGQSSFTLALARIDQDDFFCNEGTVITGGASVGWLSDLALIDSYEHLVALTDEVPDSDGVQFIPALQGLGTPYMNAHVKGAIFGLTRATTPAHIAHAVLEGIAFRTKQVVETLAEEAGVTISELKVDGGMAANDHFLQVQADVLGIPVERPATNQVTSLGVAYLAGLAIHYWDSIEDIRLDRKPGTMVYPSIDRKRLQKSYESWLEMVALLLKQTEKELESRGVE